MNKIGKRMFYEINTGNIILDKGEMQGSVIETTIEQDIASYTALSERNRDTFDVLELDYGAYSQDFRECNGYRVNVETKTLEFSYPSGSGSTVTPEIPLSTQVETLTAQKEALSDRVDFLEDVLQEMILQQAT